MDLPREIDFSKTRAPAVVPALRLAARERIAQCVRLAQALGVRLKMPTVSFDLRGKTAGQAYLNKNHVRLNAVLLNENAANFIEQIVGHEVAHLATHCKYGPDVDGHGPEWRGMMVAFGLEPNRCHSLDVTNSAVGKTYAFMCGCTKHALSARRYHKALRGAYKCNRCKKVLKPADPEASTASKPAATRNPAVTPTPRLPTKPPVRPPVPPAPTPPARPAARLPTPAMLQYAQSLAARTGLKLPPGVLQSFTACSQFIEQAKQHQTPVPPTEKQLAFAHSIAKKIGAVIPATTLASRTALSAWLDQNVPKYR